MDEAFLSLPQMLEELAAMPGELNDPDAGVSSHIHAFHIESPIELDIYRDEDGNLRIGSVPPLYRVSTSFRPSYHQIRFSAESERTETEEDLHG